MRLDDLPRAMREQAAAKLSQQRRASSSTRAPAIVRPSAPVAGPVPTEHQEQVAFLRWLELSLPEMFEMATAVPNGGYRKTVEAALLVAEGVSAGYPDVLIDLPRADYHGLRIEMKRIDAPESAVSDAQLAWHEKLRGQGYQVDVCRGADQAMEAAAAYWALGEYRAAEQA